jgi:predicted protein tyrosine phosphatase
MGVLFVCSQNRFRSPTAERVFAEYEGVETASAGLKRDAEIPLTGDFIEWAELILVIEKTHLNRLNKRFKPLIRGKRVHVLRFLMISNSWTRRWWEMLERKVLPHLRKRS